MPPTRPTFATHLELIDSRTIPHDFSTGPDLSYYTETAEFYYKLILDSARFFKRSLSKVSPVEVDRQASIADNRIVNATWGMIARGAESLPYAVALSHSKNWDHNEAANHVWCGLQHPKRAESILTSIYSQLQSSSDQAGTSALLEYLGFLRNKAAVPTVSDYVMNDSLESETRFVAAVSLGRIVRKRFDRVGTARDAVQAAIEWLESRRRK